MSHAKLTKQQKEAIGILSIGTFLEYFDLMLYVHMAVVLNELFFPKDDPVAYQLLTSFTFASTFIISPIGSFVIGWVGDQIGRKSTIMITTFIMAASCATMASVGTYAEIGIAASITMITCRMLQGFSSLGEAMGASIYLTEVLKSPTRYVACGMVGTATRVGGLLALNVALLAVSMNFNWRLAFWIGAVIAFVGIFARMRLRETPEFVDFKRRMKNRAEQSGQDIEVIENSIVYQEKVDPKTILSCILSVLIMPFYIYVTYIYLGNFMKKSLGLSSAEVISQNLKVSMCTVMLSLMTIYFVRKYHPLKITRVTIAIFTLLLLFIPHWLNNITNLFSLFFIQLIMFIPGCSAFGTLAMSVWFKHFPVAKRFRIAATSYAIGNALGFTIASFALAPLTDYFGYYALWVLYCPIIIGFLYSMNYVKKLEIKKGLYHNYPEEDFTEPDTAAKEEDFEYDLDEEYQSSNLSCEYADKLLNRLKELNLESKKKINIRLVEKAIIFAKYWHGSQRRKTGELFYSHPLAAAATLAEQYFKTDVIVAMILHDVIEDTDCHLALIEKTFNGRVAQIVDRMTKIRLDDSGHMYKQKLGEVVTLLYEMNDNEALFAKQHDRLHNLRTIAGMSPEKQKKTAEETIASLIPFVAAAAEKLNIGHKMELEKSLFITSRTILVQAEEAYI
jgi:MFS family permease